MCCWRESRSTYHHPKPHHFLNNTRTTGIGTPGVAPSKGGEKKGDMEGTHVLFLFFLGVFMYDGVISLLPSSFCLSWNLSSCCLYNRILD